jgi:hypothetical protein
MAGGDLCAAAAKVVPVQHHSELPYRDAPAFMDAWVTLSEPAIRLHGHCLAQGEYVFPGRRGGPHSDATLLALLERMNVAVTVHPTLKPEMTDEEIINATGGRWR